MIAYKFLSVVDDVPPTGYWDHALIHDIFADGRFTDKQGDGAIVVLPGKNQGHKIEQINTELNKLEWCVLIITSDEERNFPVEKIDHKNIKIWIQNPKQGRHDQYGKWPLGYTSETRKNLLTEDKDLTYFFSGQNTHERRQECLKNLKRIKDGYLNETEGFTRGLQPTQYMHLMSHAKVAPCPAGPVCAESFRLYEALEAGAIPIGDNRSAKGDHDYWHYLFPDAPFPTIDNYSDLPGYIEDQLDNFQSKANAIQAWWIKKKRDLKTQLIADVAELTGKHHKEATTVVIPVSPIKSHPSTEILEKCIDSIRHHLNCEIIITFDGVREEQEHRRADYEEFIRRALFLCNTKWNATPLLFDEHTHQVGMMRKALEIIETPTVIYVEGDTGLVVDKEIDFKYCVDKILDGTSNFIRFHFEGVIPKDHDQLMIGNDDELIRTVQYSQRPHIASTAYYRRIMEYFSPDAKSFIEDFMHGKVMTDYNEQGLQGWLQHRVHIYSKNDDIKFSVNYDGREDEQKYDKDQVF